MSRWLSRWPLLLGAVLWAVPLGYGVSLFVSEVRLREHLLGQAALPPPLTPATLPAPAFNPQAIATVMGLGEHLVAAPSAEPLTLRASFVASHGLSRALLADAGGERLYHVGESLPGGSVLRRVEVSRVVLWRQGREESLALQPTPARPLLMLNPTDSRPLPAAVHLRPGADSPARH
ncbi:type II secretion system protein N [Pseudomonas sp. ok272]|uniref:type II secretion system protein N n=1 Tax=unclassified Pseudomonas TaxID=196821 RepID=UPI003531CE6A